MIKYIFSTFLIFLTLAASAQKKSVVKLIQSKSSQVIQLNGKNVLKVYQGVFQQDYSIMRSDSAYFYVADNAFDAFSHVNITQGDTLNIYSDKLNYNGNTKIAILTDNVKMIDRDATLTTNYLTYNTATRIGTYTGGGKLVNKDNTLTSKNGYYFAFSRDSYFRYNVVLVTPDALIKTDTLRYNTGSRIAYFYGPTNIYDTKDKKDTLYTENGLYNTQTEQAFFGKKNLYKQGTKTLTGDSLFYDKLKGYGRAVKRVTFHDREQNITLKGDLATYYKKGERTVVTQDPYVIIVTEEKDSTRTDTVRNVTKPGVKAANLTAVKNAQVVVKKADALAVKQAPPNTIPIKPDVPTQAVIDTLKKVAKANPDAVKAANAIIATKVNAPGAKPFKGATPLKGAGLSAFPMAPKDTVLKITPPDKKVKRDSVYISADTLETQILTYKEVKLMEEKQHLASVRDTSAKAKKPATAEQKKNDKFLTLNPPRFKRDSSYLHRDFFADYKFPPRTFSYTLPQKGKSNISNTNGGAFNTASGSKTDKGAFGTLGGAKTDKGAFGTLNDNTSAARSADTSDVDKDPIFYTKPITLSDTARVRIIKAYHSAKLFKSDLQAKADSMFYSYADSTLRCYVDPLIWTQGSQLSGDTITMQMKNKKMDNLNMYPRSFVVNIEKGDSTNFNQVAAKRMKGFFKNGKLDRMFIVGNAESIAFSRDSSKRVDGMQRSLASKMRIYFKNNSANNIFFISKPEHRYGPLAKFKDDEKILKGFIWKPKERPVSKESIIPSYNRKIARAKAAVDKKATDAKGKALKPGEKPGADSLKNKLLVQPGVKTGKDSMGVKSPGIKTPVGGVKTDSAAVKQAAAIKPSADKPKQDKTAVTPTPVTKAAADTLKKKPAATPLKTKKDSTATKP